nr:hypothetical protein [Chroococcidiopsis sp. CCALA 051]
MERTSKVFALRFSRICRRSAGTLARGIVNKILHDPMVQLRSQQDIEARRRCMQTLQVLFNLDAEEQFG